MRPLPGLLLNCLLFLSLFASAQNGSDNNFPPPEESPVVRAVKTQGELQIDGRLEETDWQSAEPIHDFFRREPRQGGQPKYRSEVRLLYDDRNLYVGVFCRDSLGSWEFAPLSFLYLVFNENTLEDNLINDRNFISKISYLKQF